MVWQQAIDPRGEPNGTAGTRQAGCNQPGNAQICP